MPYDAANYVEVQAPAPAELTPRQKMIVLRDHLLTLHPSEFNMRRSSMCIAGHARKVLGTERGRFWPEQRDITARALGLSGSQGSALMNCVIGGKSYKKSPRQAAKVIDHYLNTGEVDWGVAAWWRPVRKAVA